LRVDGTAVDVIQAKPLITDASRRIGNFIAGMTDRFALTEHQRLFDSTPDLRYAAAWR
jgi:dGTP triphosphohydrolase